MKLTYGHMLFILFFALVWLSLAVSSAEIQSKKSNPNQLEGRRFLGLGAFRPFMRVLGMMGIPLLPLILLRQLLGTAGAVGANAQGSGAGAGLGSMGALGLIAPFGAGAGLGNIGPVGAGGGGRPFGLRPLSGLIANAAANAAGQAVAGAAGAAGGASGGGSLFFKKKRSAAAEKPSSKYSTVMGALAKLERVVDQYDLSVPDCQRLIVCELNRKSVNPTFGSFTEKMIQAFGVEGRLERSRFTSNTKSVLKDFLKAARNGLQQRECSAIYYKCPVAVLQTRQSKEEKQDNNNS